MPFCARFYNEGEESPALEAIKYTFNIDDVVIGATSAGAACIGSGPMIMGK